MYKSRFRSRERRLGAGAQLERSILTGARQLPKDMKTAMRATRSKSTLETEFPSCDSVIDSDPARVAQSRARAPVQLTSELRSCVFTSRVKHKLLQCKGHWVILSEVAARGPGSVMTHHGKLYYVLFDMLI